MADHANAIKLDAGAALTDESVEVARIWITNNAGSNVLIDAGILEDPTVFGYLLADTIRHAARAYAATWGIDEDAALQAIVDGVGTELREQFTTISTIQEGTIN
ncbi:hypothetical protein HMP09_1413 [Sphingomonas sp. HMP9]|uniref:DUF5076 domain-containing protein n=1 Tax=Sphingomonas sp. HMP9 TaxID=1517554 RepID=UPI001596D2FB|nr:DUF5076 domain-containing protein [Sphingomonas sp. HMP9]BCA62179.1 hypothetical protein HMP09_1413 [Sphingomonas sp. HMP9]